LYIVLVIAVYDSQSRCTGVLDGNLKEEIPNSFYIADEKRVVIYNSTDEYSCTLTGTGNGTYGLDIISFGDFNKSVFNALGIPVSVGNVHQYIVDWSNLSEGGMGISINIDNDHDGVFEKIIKTDKTTISILTPSIDWSTPADITYGTALGDTQLNTVVSVAGNFTYIPAAGTVLGAGTQTLHVSFTPTDDMLYNTTSADVKINVLKATPTITWSNPADTVYGTALNSTQLNATASVPGTLVYSPTNGSVLSVGTQTLHVDLTPDDATNYTNTSKNVTINVLNSTPAITWNDPADIIYGTALSSIQLDATASVPGTFVYSPAEGTVLGVGKQTLHVDLTPEDATNYTSASKEVEINVLNSTPAITWNDPADIIYGTALNNTQLDASASVNGKCTYNPVEGTVLGVGK
jgi:hypothetical protein